LGWKASAVTGGSSLVIAFRAHHILQSPWKYKTCHCTDSHTKDPKDHKHCS